ncbi:hypothetical protein CJF32_00003854 [Rutstroemia sp. NJR-2017a WRK4]|nr:hypothetical protein CJF32_00003854 [Rutstroemia sp. NJR-2017a WRK4]
MPTSSCLCGANCISYGDVPLFKFRCHCTDEWRLTGTAFCLNVTYPSDKLETLSGSLVEYSRTAASGETITSHSCGTCGSLLYRDTTRDVLFITLYLLMRLVRFPGIIVIKAGCMDSKTAVEDFKPDIEIFTRTRASWVPAIEGAKQELGDFSDLGEL